MLNLITDRTEADVAYWKYLLGIGWASMSDDDKNFWLGIANQYDIPGMLEVSDGVCKGAYNAVDLNRVESAVAYLSNKLVDSGLLPNRLTTKTDWDFSDVPTESDMIRYLDNVKLLKSAVESVVDTPTLPDSMLELTYSGANAIEQTLAAIDGWTEADTESQFFCDDLYVGEM